MHLSRFKMSISFFKSCHKFMITIIHDNLVYATKLRFEKKIVPNYFKLLLIIVVNLFLVFLFSLLANSSLRAQKLSRYLLEELSIHRKSSKYLFAYIFRN